MLNSLKLEAEKEYNGYSLTLFLSGFFNANSVRGGADSAPPEISKTTQRRDILQTALDRLRRDLQLL